MPHLFHEPPPLPAVAVPTRARPLEPPTPHTCTHSSSQTLSASTPVVESKVRLSFPFVLAGLRKLLGIDLRRKLSVFGLKNIDVYAFGVYIDHSDVKKLLKKNIGKTVELRESDICKTASLQIVFGKLNIRSVHTAFKEFVGSILKKFGGGDNKELLQKFRAL